MITALTFVTVAIAFQVPIAAATGSAVIIIAATIGLQQRKGKPNPAMITPAWQGLA